VVKMQKHKSLLEHVMGESGLTKTKSKGFYFKRKINVRTCYF